MSLIKQGDQEFFIKAKETQEGKNLLKSLKISDPPEMIRKDQIINYL